MLEEQSVKRKSKNRLILSSLLTPYASPLTPIE